MARIWHLVIQQMLTTMDDMIACLTKNLSNVPPVHIFSKFLHAQAGRECIKLLWSAHHYHHMHRSGQFLRYALDVIILFGREEPMCVLAQLTGNPSS